MRKINQTRLGALPRCALIACVAGCGSHLASSPPSDASAPSDARDSSIAGSDAGAEIAVSTDASDAGNGTISATSDAGTDAFDADDGAASSAVGDAIDASPSQVKECEWPTAEPQDGAAEQRISITTCPMNPALAICFVTGTADGQRTDCTTAGRACVVQCPGPPAPTTDRLPGALVRQHDHIHIVGDSYINAVWYVPLETMVANAKDETGAVMSVTWTVNGVPGYAPATVYANRQAMIFDYDPDFLIVELGRNSVGYDLTQVGADVDQLISAILNWKPTIRLAWIGAMWGGELWTQVGAQPPTWNNYNDAAVAATNVVIARVCAKYNVPYVDGRGFSLQYEPYYNPNKNLTGQSAAGPPNGLTNDGTHPNVNGAQVMSQAMFDGLSFSSN